MSMKAERPSQRPGVSLAVVVLAVSAVGPVVAQTRTGVLLPDGREVVSWERPTQSARTYYVDNQHPRASDSNPGTKELPFLTINRAAQILEPGEHVVIMSGVYRERVTPARGGTGPEKMISYEAAPGAKVVVKGSRLVKTGWKASTGFRLSRGGQPPASQPQIYQLDLEQLQLEGYNPFGMVNVLDDRGATSNIGAPPQGLKPYLLRRGMVFVDGRTLEQVELYREMAQRDGTFWAEHNGLVLHVRLPGDANPADREVEVVVQEQVFAPKERHLGYIRVRGIIFEHGANGFPVPQRGIVSANRGHHWIIEDCVIRHANSVALDIGNETWNADRPPLIGHSIVRGNHISDAGVCGLAGMGVMETLVEYNMIEDIGWQNVEGMWESGGIKLHTTKSCLLRNNVIRNLRYAPGIWLDYGCANTRVTANVIGDIKETLRGGIYLEASHEQNMLDHNIIWDVTMGERGSATGTHRDGGWCIVNDGSDEAVIAHNLFGRCEDAGVKIRTVESRIVEGRGGTARWNRLLNNIFFRCGKSIDLSHRENTVEGNLYVRGGAGGQGLNWVATPEVLRLDLPAWQRYLGFDKAGAYADLNVDVNLPELQMTCSLSGDVPDVQTLDHFGKDFLGSPAGSVRKPGPFVQLPAAEAAFDIDPRAGPR